MNKTLVAVMVALPLFAHASAINEYAQKITTGTYSFEQPSELEGWKAVGGSVALSQKRAKVGKTSSLWKWESGGHLLMEKPDGLKEAATEYEGGSPEKYERKYVDPGLEGGVKLWLYNETPDEGQLSLQVGHDAVSVLDNPRYQIPVNLNFKGWRAIWVHFEEDAKVGDYDGDMEMNAMAMVPSPGTSGALHIDWMNFSKYISNKRHSDYQHKNNKSATTRYDSYTILAYDEGRKLMKPSRLGKEEIKAFETIRDRLEFLVVGSHDGELNALPENHQKTLKSFFKKGNQAFEKLNIRAHGSVLNGTPIFSGRDEHSPSEALNFQEVGQNILFPLAFEYRVTGNPQALERALTLLDYLNDQGFALGSANGTADHMIRVNSFGLSMFLLRGELVETGRLQQNADALAWFSMLGSAFNTPENEGVNTDFIRGTAFPKLISVLLMDDSREKAGAMNGLLGYFNHVSGFAPGYSDTIKPDYTLYHHRSAYQSAYGVSMLNTMAIIDWLLDGTVYELSAETKRILTAALDAQLKMANTYDLHPGISGRIQSRRALDRLLLPAYAFAALSGMDVADSDAAAVFNRIYKPELNKLNFPSLAYNGTLGTAELMEQVADAAAGKIIDPDEGHYTFPYGAFSTHRRDGWMACVRGWSQYVWDFEAGSKQENDLGRYVSHGAMFILPEDGFIGSAQDLDTGYHWGFLPGATTKALPVEETIFKYVATPKYLECKHRNYTDETFCGGVSMGGNGFFSMILHDTVAPDDERILFDDSFRATKSYFFVDNRIYCLGTGIENTDERFETATTLFQSTVDFDAGLKDGVIRDANGNAYVLIGDQKVEVERGEQSSWGKKRVPTSGPNVRAWINHGKAPKGGSYEYMIAVNQAKPHVPFKVLQKDSTAHIISHDTPVRPVTAYAVFKPEEFQGQGVVAEVDTPLLLMTGRNDAALKLAVSDPDLRLEKWGHNMSFMPREIVHTEGRSHTAAITLAGEWELAEKIDGVKAKAKRGKTTVRIELRHGFTKELLFRKKQ